MPDVALLDGLHCVIRVGVGVIDTIIIRCHRYLYLASFEISVRYIIFFRAVIPLYGEVKLCICYPDYLRITICARWKILLQSEGIFIFLFVGYFYQIHEAVIILVIYYITAIRRKIWCSITFRIQVHRKKYESDISLVPTILCCRYHRHHLHTTLTVKRLSEVTKYS